MLRRAEQSTGETRLFNSIHFPKLTPNSRANTAIADGWDRISDSISLPSLSSDIRSHCTQLHIISRTSCKNCYYVMGLCSHFWSPFCLMNTKYLNGPRIMLRMKLTPTAQADIRTVSWPHSTPTKALGLASSCIRGGLDWILGKISLLKEWSGIGTGCPGKWWSHHPWRGSKTVWMWHFKTWFNRYGGDGLTVGLDDLRGLFQP